MTEEGREREWLSQIRSKSVALKGDLSELTQKSSAKNGPPEEFQKYRWNFRTQLKVPQSRKRSRQMFNRKRPRENQS